jgi:polysaccharide export outer membrane protein
MHSDIRRYRHGAEPQRRWGLGARAWTLALLIALAALGEPSLVRGQAAPAGLPSPSVGDTIVRPTGTLRSGDLLKIKVYRDSELSGQFLIDAQGNVQIPGLGVIRAAGLDPTQVQDRLADALRSRGFRSPELAVQPLIRVSVLGMVHAPGLYPVDPGVSLIQLITQAGGPAEHANLKRVQVIRDDRVFTINLKSALSGSAAGRVALYSNDVVYIPESHNIFSRDNIGLVASVAALAVSVVTLIQVSHR